MAIVVTALVPDLVVFPWESRGPPIDQKSVQPFGVLQAKIRNSVVAGAGTGDNQVLTVTTALPANNMYVLTDIAAYIRTVGLVGANNWEPDAHLLYFDSGGPLIADTIEYPMNYSGNLSQTNTTSVMVWTPFAPFPTFLEVGGSTWVSIFTNLTDDDISGTFNFMARWLMYTVEQQYDANVGTPLLTR